ncbi:hypothetical protein QR680_009533 [Steinernema hermaphroditum]|uniref:Phospholipase A2 domain-containing protein n=1 Tax=Steinernema hermaphroditum TaxID=289476 RepID=A0AA39IKN8_9BILA|nr:hypothetical protein QR680_009533 [Steinernema hermaphroditum]
MYVVLLLFAVLGVFGVRTADSAEEPEWSCGTDAVSHWLSEATIEKSCPLLKGAINQCCMNHDQCYDDQRGRTFCDDAFCNCLVDAAKPSEECSEEDAPTFCLLVREFGEAAYEASGSNRTTETPLKMILLTTTALPRKVAVQKTAIPKRAIGAEEAPWIGAVFERMDE